MRLSLKSLFLLYGLSAAAAVATPFAIRGFEDARRKAIPVNREAPLEGGPAVVTVANSGDRTYALPACIGPEGSEYYSDRGYFYVDGQTGDKRYFESDVWSSDFSSCAVAKDGTVYVLASQNRAGRLRAYLGSGQLKWNVALPEIFSRLPISQNGSLYLVTRSWNDPTELRTYDRDGEERWKLQVARTGEAQSSLVAPAIVPDGHIYVIAGDRDAPELMAIAPDSRKLWSTSLPGHASELVVGADGRIFLKLPTGNLIAFDARGQKLWEFHSQNRGIDGGIALGPDGTLYFASLFLNAISTEGN